MASGISSGYPHKSPHELWKEPTKVAKTPAQVVTELTNHLVNRGIGFNTHAAFFSELVSQFDTRSTYPPYDILSAGENKYLIRIALAGFSKEDLEITFKDQVLTIEGSKEDESIDEYFHKGIAARAFKQAFPLAEYVTGEGAEMKDGVLTVKLEREIPEELKPKTIKIK